MPTSLMPWRCSSPLSITSMALANGPAGWSRSPAITSTRRTPACAARLRQQIVEHAGAGDAAHREMRHRLEAGRAQRAWPARSRSAAGRLGTAVR